MTQEKKPSKQFEITGTIRIGTQTRPFTKHLAAPTPTAAIEKTKTLFGSKNKIKRRDITIAQAKEWEEHDRHK